MTRRRSVYQYLTLRNAKYPTKHVYAGDTRGASKADADWMQNPATLYYHPDHLGSSQYVTNDSQEVTQHAEYFPSGELWADESDSRFEYWKSYTYTGKELDISTGLFYYGARYYEPRVGTWLSPDPALRAYMGGDVHGGVYHPLHLGLYTHVLNNPLMFADPNGMFEMNWRAFGRGAVKGLVVGAAVGLAAGAIIASAGTAAPAVAAGLSLLGGVSLGIGGAQAITGRDLHGRALSDEQRSELIGDLVGGTIGGMGGAKVGARLATPAAEPPSVRPTAPEAAPKAEPAPVEGGSASRPGRWCKRRKANAVSRSCDPASLSGRRTRAAASWGLRPVERTFVTASAALVELTVELADGAAEKIRVTPSHPFWVRGRGWIGAGDLAAGDKLAGPANLGDQIEQRVGAVRRLAETGTVYNLQVGQFHSYFVGRGWNWVHNGCGDANGAEPKAWFISQPDGTLVERELQATEWWEDRHSAGGRPRSGFVAHARSKGEHQPENRAILRKRP